MLAAAASASARSLSLTDRTPAPLPPTVNAGKNKPAQQTITGKPASKLDEETEDFHRELPQQGHGSQP